jgi:hypothetical protein
MAQIPHVFDGAILLSIEVTSLRRYETNLERLAGNPAQ